MTNDELKERIMNGQKVLCNSAEEVLDVLDYLRSLGFELSPLCHRRLRVSDLLTIDPEFLCPGMDFSEGRISCYRTNYVKGLYRENPETVILYKDVPSLDVTSIEEFQSAFAELWGGGSL